jgi:iron complex outermembrane receptor protein
MTSANKLRFCLHYSLHVVLFGTGLSLANADESSQPAGDLLFEEIPVVFSASKYEQKISDSPASVHIITAQDIDHYGWQTLQEILDSVPGFYVSHDYAYGYAGSRGFSRPGDYNSRYLFLLDGIRVNDAVYDAEGINRDSIVNVDLIDRVEVISGPGSSLYGSNAFLGVVNIVTRDGQDFQGIEVALNLAEHGSRESSISGGNRTSNGLDFLISGQVFESDGNDKIYYAEYDNPATNNGFAINMDRTESTALFGKFSYRDLQLSLGYVERTKRVPTASFDTLFNSPLYEVNDEKLSVGAQYTRNFSNTTTLTTRFAYNTYEYQGDYPYDYAEPGDPLDLAVWDDSADGNFLVGEAALTRRFDRHILVTGIEYIDYFKLQQKAYDPYYTLLDDTQDTNRVGLYIQDEFSLTDRLIVTLGGRFDKQSKSEDGEYSPRLAFRFRLGEDDNLPSNLRLSFSSAFRAPNAFENYYNDGGVLHKPTADLAAETIDTLELTLYHYFSPGLVGIASLFSYQIENLIELVIDPTDELFIFQNRSEAKAKGLDLALDGRLAEVTGLISYSFVDTKDSQTDEQLGNSPRHLGKINLSMPLWSDLLRAGIEARYASKRLTVNGASTDGVTTANLILQSEEILPGLSLSARVINVFDEDIWLPVGPEHRQDSLLQPGRTFQFNILYRF